MNLDPRSSAPLRRPQHSTVVAYLALFIALGSGVAVAATQITSSKQIKNGIVNSGDLKNKTIKAADIDIPTIPLAVGHESFTGLSMNIPTGTGGAPASPDGNIATLSLPSGKFFVTAHALLGADDGGGSAYCVLTYPGGKVVDVGANVSGVNYAAIDHTPESISSSMIAESGAPFEVRLACADNNTGVEAFDRGMEAIQLRP